MDDNKRQRLEEAGWTVGEADELLDLSAADRVVIELRLSLRDRLQRRRIAETNAAETDVEPIEDTSIEGLITMLVEHGEDLEDINESIQTALECVDVSD